MALSLKSLIHRLRNMFTRDRLDERYVQYLMRRSIYMPYSRLSETDYSIFVRLLANRVA